MNPKKQQQNTPPPPRQKFIHESQVPDGFITPLMLQATTTIAKGDIFYVDANGKFARLPKGTTGQVLTMSSSGLPSWA